MSATPEQWVRVTDPTTSAAELQELAAAEPEIWPQIAAHPNVYPDLLTWMRQNGLVLPILESAASAAPESPVSSQAEPASSSDASAQLHPPIRPVPRDALERGVAAPALSAGAVLAWIRKRARLLIWVGAGLATVSLAFVLVMTLIVVPQQRAAEEAAAAALELERATDRFDTAVTRCERVNDQLAAALTKADGTLSVDPATLADASVVSALAVSIEEVSPTAPCEAPSMASGLTNIEEQTVQVDSDADRVTAAVKVLSDAMGAIQRSITEKQQADAAAAAEAQQREQEASRAARTWRMEDAQGYSFTGALEIGAPTTSASYGDYSLGDACGFDPTTDVGIPVSLTVTATTTGFDTPISALVSLSESRADQPHDVQIEGYYSTGPDCKSSSGYGSLILNGVSWAEPFATGESSTHRFVVIIRNWKTPATPNGDTAFLGALWLTVNGGQNSGFAATEYKSLSLSNTVR